MKTLRRAIVVAGLALALAGCISLFPKTPPVQLYRFGSDQGAAPPDHAPRSFNVQRMPTAFTHAAEGDRLLTIDGDQAAYIAGARWDEPASTLFDQAETNAFERSAGPARLLAVSDTAAAPVSLKLDVQTFEARYLAGPKAGPTVVVRVHALLVNALTRKVVADQVFESQQAAAGNRVGLIVQAYDAATTDVLARVADWTGREASAAG